MGGGVGVWFDSRSYMLGYGERFLGPCRMDGELQVISRG